MWSDTPNLDEYGLSMRDHKRLDVNADGYVNMDDYIIYTANGGW